MKDHNLSAAIRNFAHSGRPFAAVLAITWLLLLSPSAARADGDYYGTVLSYADGTLVVKTTKHSTGHWKVDAATRVNRAVREGDWVFVRVETSGHITELQFEERPAPRSGVIKEIHDNVLTVRSGNGAEEWNLTETTILTDVARSDLAVGDNVGAKLYKNHNLAEIRVIKSGAK